ncbi:sensor histidine kinase [Gorillibacterium massiliense]|uniref:sensor histidine kinase n=1 Tax=Gorillibacterium massiliense TaxID=1280390 RepID=UPI0004B60FDF|nr:sensor histidine kinase [Gorillibacterium massiliense]
MKNKLGFLSIRHKLMAAAIACILIPAALTQLISSSLAKDAVQSQAVSSSQDSMMLLNTSLSNQFKSMLNTANYITTNPDMISYFKLVSFGQTANDDASKRFLDKNKIINQLDTLTISDSSYVTVILTDGSTFTNYSTNDFNPSLFTQEPWFKELDNISGMNVYWVGTRPTQFQYISKENPYQISLARTLRYDDARIYGYVVVTQLETRINQLFKRLPSDQEIMLIDGDNRILSSGDVSKIGQIFPDIGSGSGQLNTTVVTVGATKYLITEQPLSFNDWRLVSKQRYAKAIVNINSIFNRVFLIQFASIVVFLLILLALLRAFTKPIVRLGRTTSAVQRGNLSVRSGIRGKDEIGRLGYLFDQMLDRVQEMIAEVSETQNRKRKAELRMLQAQIHPHFLFNVLNSIRMKVLRKGDPESAKMISSLSTLLRMTITREEDEIVLHEELELLGHYVDLMNLRQKEEVQLSLAIQSEAMLVKVPRLFLQPIVENALIHGFNQKAGLIRIQAEMNNRVLQMSVEDNGVGMEPEAVKALNQKLAEAGQTDPDRIEGSANGVFSGMGLINVVERMRLLWGERFSVKVESTPNQGTIIRITIAYERADGDV